MSVIKECDSCGQDVAFCECHVQPGTQMMRAHELARQLLALTNDPVVCVIDSLGAPTPVMLEPLHNNYRMFQIEDTVVIAGNLEARNRENERLRAQGK